MNLTLKTTTLIASCFFVLGLTQNANAVLLGGDIVDCTFNNTTVLNGTSVTAFQNSSVPFGQACVSEQRACSLTVLSGSYNFATCSVGLPADCNFNGATVPHGSSVTGFTASAVPYGSSCATYAEVRTCSNGVLSGSAVYGSCTVGQPASCLFNGATVLSGDSVQAYATSTVNFGSQCSVETRTCLNGVLSGSNSFGSCTVGQPASCLFNGKTIANGEVVTAFASAAVPFGQSCTAESRTCNNGVLSGNATSVYDSCVVSPAASCDLNGVTIASGSTTQAFVSATVPFGSQCVSETRTCTDGKLSGSATNASCSVLPAADCSLNGAVVNHGSSVTAFVSASVPFGQTCASENRTCNNGVLSGSATNASCSVLPAPVPPPAASCTFNGATLQSGASVVAFVAATVPFGSQCISQTRTCTDGQLSGTATNASCSVLPAANCSFNGAVVNHGSSVTAFVSASVPNGQTCTQEVRSCNNGVLSGSATNASCTVQPAPVPVPTPTPTPTPTPVPTPVPPVVDNTIFWEFPEQCGCGSKGALGYKNSLFSIDGGKTWNYILKDNKAPDNLQAIWDYMVKNYGLNKCKRPNVKYVKATHKGYVKFDKPYLPKPGVCKFIEVTVSDDDDDGHEGREHHHHGILGWLDRDDRDRDDHDKDDRNKHNDKDRDDDDKDNDGHHGLCKKHHHRHKTCDHHHRGRGNDHQDCGHHEHNEVEIKFVCESKK